MVLNHLLMGIFKKKEHKLINKLLLIAELPALGIERHV